MCLAAEALLQNLGMWLGGFLCPALSRASHDELADEWPQIFSNIVRSREWAVALTAQLSSSQARPAHSLMLYIFLSPHSDNLLTSGISRIIVRVVWQLSVLISVMCI